MGIGWWSDRDRLWAISQKNILIHHNYSEGNAGFIESSWDYDWPRYRQEIYNWRVAFNVCYDGQSWLFLLAPCNEIYFDNNRDTTDLGEPRIQWLVLT